MTNLRQMNQTEGYLWQMRRIDPDRGFYPLSGFFDRILEQQFRESPPGLSFPYLWWPESNGVGGAAVTDPAMLHVNLPLGEDPFGDGITYEIPLANAVEDFIDALTAGSSDKVVDPEARKLCRGLARRLHELARRLDEKSGWHS